MWEVSFAVDCQKKILKCDYAAKENYEVKVIVLTLGFILINKVHRQRKNSGTQNFWNFVIWRGVNDAKLIFRFPYFQFCLRVEAVMVPASRHQRN